MSSVADDSELERAKGWSVARLDELAPGERRVPVRAHFGISAFGINAWRGAEIGDRVIDDHDEVVERHEELYLVVSGRAAFTIDDDEVDAPPGTFVFAPAHVQRGAVAEERGTVVLAIGGEPGEPFSSSAWEDWDALGIQEPLDAGRYAEAAERYREALVRHPDHPGVLFNLACLLSLAGRHDEALERLGRSIELQPEIAKFAHTDSDFDAIRDDPRFVAITAG